MSRFDNTVKLQNYTHEIGIIANIIQRAFMSFQEYWYDHNVPFTYNIRQYTLNESSGSITISIECNVSIHCAFRLFGNKIRIYAHHDTDGTELLTAWKSFAATIMEYGIANAYHAAVEMARDNHGDLATCEMPIDLKDYYARYINPGEWALAESKKYAIPSDCIL